MFCGRSDARANFVFDRLSGRLDRLLGRGLTCRADPHAAPIAPDPDPALKRSESFIPTHLAGSRSPHSPGSAPRVRRMVRALSRSYVRRSLSGTLLGLRSSASIPLDSALSDTPFALLQTSQGG